MCHYDVNNYVHAQAVMTRLFSTAESLGLGTRLVLNKNIRLILLRLATLYKIYWLLKSLYYREKD